MSKDRVYVLEIVQLNGVKTQYVNKPTFVLGRGTTSAVKINDQNISREHVRISFNGGIKIQDLNSSNGTYVNGKRLSPLQDFKVADSDLVVLGKSAFTFKISTFTPHDEVKQFVPVTPAAEVHPQQEDVPQKHKARIDQLIQETKDQMFQLKRETEIHLEQKKVEAAKEIEGLWAKHQEKMEVEKKELKAQHEIEIDLEREKFKNEIFIEKNKILTEAEKIAQANLASHRKRIEDEKTEQINQAVFYRDQIDRMKTELEDLNQKVKSLKDTNVQLALAQKKLNDLNNESTKIEDDLAEFKKAQKSADELSTRITHLIEKKEILTNLIADLDKQLNESKIKAKSEVEKEFKNLREIENKKFEDYKVAELKELQKIRLEHTNSYKNFSAELSQEIATKIEMELKASKEFDFEKSLEIINSVIQVKSASEVGEDSDHQEHLENWKKKQRSVKSQTFIVGFMTAVIAYFGGSFMYSKLSTDSLQQELKQIAEKRQQSEIENRFIPEKTDKVFDTYVESTIYTDNFSEVYLDQSLQKEWVKKATFYLLHNWKIDEQKTIQVLANSKSLVENIDEASKKLTKNGLNSELNKLSELENENIKIQVRILGTNVKYEAFKKFEKKFFTDKLQKRSTASQK